ncbi:MAG: hypothetical protein GXO80_04220, partial [Chlorobi bacterium]|nr:hypothetical protein [Chlorobiota bacterium]
MSLYDYNIHKLTDFNRLPEIGKLVHDTLVESGHISSRYNQFVDLYPELNTIPETIILIAELNGKIIGTNSITLDSSAGLHSDFFFKEETNFIRKNESKILGSSWRIATEHQYRKNIRLFLDLIQNTFFAAKEMHIETCLFVFDKQHEEFYKKLIDAKTVAEKTCNIEPEIDIPMILMRTDTENSQKHLSKIFT